MLENFYALLIGQERLLAYLPEKVMNYNYRGFAILQDQNRVVLRIEFFVDDVDSIYQQLSRRGLTDLEAPRDMPWGLRSVTFSDYTGRRIRFSQIIRT